jgi:imidazolonepropionase-like amidohydrolase
MPASGVSVMTPEPRLLIENGTLIDGTGAAPVENATIVVEGNRIASVGSATSARAGDTVIDATGKYILPGLIDAHCHLSLHQGAMPGVKYTSSAEFCALWAARVLGKVLNAGVTGIVVPGGKWFTDVIVRDAVASGMLEGPRMIAAARALGNYGGIFDADAYPGFEGEPADAAGVLCNTREAFVLETRKQCRRGVDLIKLADDAWGDAQTIAEEEMSAVVEEAHRHGVKVAIHARGSASTRAAAQAGVDLIYHADLAAEADLDIVAKAGMPIAPVLTSPWIAAAHGAGRGFVGAGQERLRAQLHGSYKMVRDARDRGIPVLSGTDTGNASAFHHGKWHGKEAELFVREVGMTPMEAILANTSHNAAVLGLHDEVGVVAAGKLADIVVWNSNPVADITVLQRPDEISAVIKDGRPVNRGAGGFQQLVEEPGRARMLPQG